MIDRLAWASAFTVALFLHLGCGRGQDAYDSSAAWYPDPSSAPAARASATGGKAPAALPELTDRSELSDYLAYAAMNNAGLRAAFERWKAAAERVPQVTALPDPELLYRYMVETGGTERHRVSLAQGFPWFGKLALRGDAAGEAALAEGRRFEAAKLTLFHQVRDAWYEYYYLERSIQTIGENQKLLEQTERVLRTRYAASAAEHPDVIRTQVELGKLVDDLRAMEDMRRPTVARLNAAMNRPADAAVPPPATITDRAVDLQDAEVLAWLAESSPQVQAMAHEITAAEIETKLARKEYYPDVMVGLMYEQVPRDTDMNALMPMISMNLPIWYNKLSAGVREARLRRLAATHDRDQLVNDLNAQAKMVLYRLRDAQRKIGLYRDTLLPKARQSYKATDAAFRGGKASFTDLIDAERILLEFELSFQRALADKHQRLSELEMLVGREIPSGGNATAPAAVQTDDRRPRETPERPNQVDEGAVKE